MVCARSLDPRKIINIASVMHCIATEPIKWGDKVHNGSLHVLRRYNSPNLAALTASMAGIWLELVEVYKLHASWCKAIAYHYTW